MIRHIIAAFIMIACMTGSALTYTNISVSAAPNCDATLLGIPPWYRGLTTGAKCEITMPKITSGKDAGSVDINKAVYIIALNVLQALLVITAYVTVGYLIKGGFMYITSTGAPDGMQKAKTTIKNAIIGLVIAALAASIVNAVAGVI